MVSHRHRHTHVSILGRYQARVTLFESLCGQKAVEESSVVDVPCLDDLEHELIAQIA